MANEITNTGLTNDLRMAYMITQEIALFLRDTQNLRNSQFMRYYGSINGTGSDVIKVRRAALDGYDSFEAVGEIATPATPATALTDASVNITVARQYLAYYISDLASMTAFGPSDLDPFRLAESIAASYETRFSELQSTTAGALSTNTVGNASDQFSVDLFFEAIFKLEQSASNKGATGPFAMVLHPKQMVELQDSLRNETSNAVSMMQATQDMLKAKGQGFAGTLFGCELYRSSHVQNAGGAHLGYMITPNCIGYADGAPVNLPRAVDFMQMGKVTVELARDSQHALTQVIGHAYLGLAIIDEDRGCLVKSTT